MEAATFKIGELTATVRPTGPKYELVFRFDNPSVDVVKKLTVKSGVGAGEIIAQLVGAFGVLDGPGEEWAAFTDSAVTRTMCHIVALYLQ